MTRMELCAASLLQAVLCLPLETQLEVFNASQKPITAAPPAALTLAPQAPQPGNISAAAGKGWCVVYAPMLPFGRPPSRPFSGNSTSSNSTNSTGPPLPRLEDRLPGWAAEGGGGPGGQGEGPPDGPPPGQGPPTVPPWPIPEPPHLRSSSTLDPGDWVISGRAVLGPDAPQPPKFTGIFRHTAGLCRKPAILLNNVEIAIPLGNALPAAALPAATGGPRPGNATVNAYTMKFMDSAWVECPRPITNCSRNGSQSPGSLAEAIAQKLPLVAPCLAAAYALVNPDNDPAAVAAAREAAAARGAAAGGGGVGGAGGGNSSYGVNVVLPAVLGSIGKWVRGHE